MQKVQRPGLATNSYSFYLFFLSKKSLICLEGKSMTPNQQNAFLFRSSQQLPCLWLGPFVKLFWTPVSETAVGIEIYWVKGNLSSNFLCINLTLSTKNGKSSKSPKKECGGFQFLLPVIGFSDRSSLALTVSRLFSRRLSDGFLSAFSHQPNISRFPWIKVRLRSYSNFITW